MSPLIVLLGGLMLFGNPDMKTDTVRGEVSYFSTTGFAKAGSEKLSGSGSLGWGASLTGEYLDHTPLRHTLGFQRYETSKWRLHIYSLGLDYLLYWPKLPVQLALGGEIGSAQLEPQGYNLLKAGKERYGWEIHAEALHYFVLRDQLIHGFLRPAWKVYDLEVDADGTPDLIYGRAPSLTAGIGIRF